MRDWLALAADLEQAVPAERERPAGDEALPCQKGQKCQKSGFVTFDTFGHPPPHLSGQPEKAVRPANSAPPAPFRPGLVGEWERGVMALSPSEPPCAGFRHWPAVHASLRRFLRDHAETACDLNWPSLDLFGVHPVVAAVRGDCVGALVTGTGRAITGMTADAITFGHLTYRRHPSPGHRVLIWEFTRAAS